MKFKTKNETDFFNFVDELCTKNNINGTNQVIKEYDYYRGFMTIELGSPFLNRLEVINKEDFDLLVSKYSDLE
jgi:hypothetical protein